MTRAPWTIVPRRAPAVERIEPTAEEARNGWDADSLSKYVAERRAAQAMAISTPRKTRITRCNGATWHWPIRGRWRR
jgi:hypothetical protein